MSAADEKLNWTIMRTQPLADGLGTWAIPKTLERLRQAGAHVVLCDTEEEEGLIAAVKKHRPNIIVSTYAKLSKSVLDAALPALKAVIKSGTGIDALDIDAMKALNIPVTNLPDYGAAAVAECALLLLINLSRGMNIVSRECLATGWCDPDLPGVRGMDLFGKTLGLIGVGHIGSHIAHIGLGLGMKVHACDPAVSAEAMAELGVIKVESIDEICATADVVVPMLPLSKETEGIISAERIAMMKSSAILVNVARGALCDEKALAEAVRSGNIRGVGADVFSDEPMQLRGGQFFSDLIGSDNFVMTPHYGGWTDDCWKLVESMVFDRCEEIMQGRRLTVSSTDPRLQGQDRTKVRYARGTGAPLRVSLPALMRQRVAAARQANGVSGGRRDAMLSGSVWYLAVPVAFAAGWCCATTARRWWL